MPPVVVALLGNPNAGKSTLFNALSGLRQHVGNYPGVTVDLKVGQCTAGVVPLTLVDLPGTYSLAPRSPDELVTVNLLLGKHATLRPQVVLCVADASNLERHLYLATQAMDLGLPVVLAVNMLDLAIKQGINLDLAELAARTGLTVVGVQANAGVGIDKLKAVLAVADKLPAPKPVPLPAELDAEAATLAGQTGLAPVLARRVLLDVGGAAEAELVGREPSWAGVVASARERLKAAGVSVPAIEAKVRYAWIREATRTAVTKPAARLKSGSDRLDRFLTHRLWGTLTFFAVMFCMFQAIFLVADPAKAVIQVAQSWLAALVNGAMSAGPLRSLLVDGVLQGVGSVVVFLPQILILFAFIAVLEDCGYMARAAFLMDRVMSRAGLNGKSFIPLLSSVACAVPGIMATRVIENRRDRLATIMVAPLMSCSARLPVYAFFIAAFLQENRPWWVPGLALFGMYMIGFVVAPIVALLLKRSALRGPTPLFVMELPAYKRPNVRTVVYRMRDAGTAFLRRAGTIILATMIVIWGCLYFPTPAINGRSYPERLGAIEQELEATDLPPEAKQTLEAERNQLVGAWKRGSILGQAGRAIEPAVRPLGWDWRIGMAALASFPAREVFVGTYSLVYDLGEVGAASEGGGESDNGTRLSDAVKRDWESDPVRGKYATSVALSVMVFIALCCQCASTLAVIRRETGGWAWPAFTFAYMTGLAYVGALVTFQVGRLVQNILG